jgi:hypothetical protein
MTAVSTKWSAYTGAGTPTTVSGFSVNSLANAAVASGSAIDNRTTLYMLADWDCTVTLASAIGTGTIDLYLVNSLDGGTTTPDTSVVPALEWLVGSFTLVKSQTTHVLGLQRKLLTPGKPVPVIVNNTGVAFAAAAAFVLRYDTYDPSSQ